MASSIPGDSEAEGFIYVATNPAMEGYVKIGRTARTVERRIKDLDRTALPLPFEVYFAARVANPTQVEALLREVFKPHRTRQNREFYEIDPEQAKAALEIGMLEDVTPRDDCFEDEQEAAEVEAALGRLPNFRMPMANVPVGATLEFVRDQSITATVLDETTVDFGGQQHSLSSAAKQALATLGTHWKSVQGPQYWMYEGETLASRRRRASSQ